MTETPVLTIPDTGLQSSEHEKLLNIIDSLRLQGIKKYIDLPQLIVCGDQSSGKSSVLEALSGLKFPTKENLCTRFPIELVLRRDQSISSKISIDPAENRDEKTKKRLRGFRADISSVEDFPGVVRSAEEAMGLTNGTKDFSEDILRVELWGPSQPHLTLVDLPGLYHAATNIQSRDGAESVKKLVQSYMARKRTIILAVISASTQIASQVVTTYTRDYDPTGCRTIGIITKPDAIGSKSETEEFVNLANNKIIEFHLGWHVLRNRGPDERHFTAEKRDKAEQQFFAKGKWKDVPSKHVGIETLKPKLSQILFKHIITELDSIFREIEQGITESNAVIKKLGKSRSLPAEQRDFLLDASEKFEALIKSAVEGRYHDTFFGSLESDEDDGKRLRAVVQNKLYGFADTMRTRGHAVEVVEKNPREPEENMPEQVLRPEFLQRIGKQMALGRGMELPGAYNPEVTRQLFVEQAKYWPRLVQETTQSIVDSTRLSLSLVLEHTVDKHTADRIWEHIITPKMDALEAALEIRVDKILQPFVDGYPMTFNNDFISDLQRRRNSEKRKVLSNKAYPGFSKNPESAAPEEHTWTGTVNIRNLLDELSTESVLDAKDFACVEALNSMEAYYQVALKIVIEAFAIYAIEADLLTPLAGIFKPSVVSRLDSDILEQVAGESKEAREERKASTAKLHALQRSLRELRGLGASRPVLSFEAGTETRNGFHHPEPVTVKV